MDKVVFRNGFDPGDQTTGGTHWKRHLILPPECVTVFIDIAIKE